MMDLRNERLWRQWKAMVRFKTVAYISSAWRCFYGVQDTLYMMGPGLVKYDLLFVASGKNRGVRHRRDH